MVELWPLKLAIIDIDWGIISVLLIKSDCDWWRGFEFLKDTAPLSGPCTSYFNQLLVALAYVSDYLLKTTGLFRCDRHCFFFDSQE